MGERTAPTGTRRPWAVLAVVTGALFLEGTDIAMLNVAVASIAADIGLPADGAHWVVSAYVLAYGGFMIVGGRAADVLGRRRVFLGALTVFVVFSGLGGFADEAWVLILARFVTGATAGFMTPAGFSLLTTTFPEGHRRNRALAIYGAIGAAGFYSGVVVGGALTTLSWRWVFFAPVVIGLAFLLTGRLTIRPDPPRPVRVADLDLGGALTLTAAMVSVIFGVVVLGEGEDVVVGAAALGIAAALLLAFAMIERKVAEPLLRAGILRQGRLAHASLAGLLFMGSFMAFQFVLALFLQNHLGWTPLETGLTFTVMCVELLVAPFFTPRLVERFGNVRVMTAGLLVAVVAYAIWLRVDESWTVVQLAPTLALVGIAFALVYAPMTAAATDGLREEDHGVAGGVVYTALQFGAALGVAVASIALVGMSDGALDVDDYQRAAVVPAIGAAIAVVVGVGAGVARPRAVPARSGPVEQSR